MDKVSTKREGVEKIKEIMKVYAIEPDEINKYLESIGSAPIAQKQKLSQLLLRPDVDLNKILNTSANLSLALNPFDVQTLKQAEVQVKYDTYISKEKELVRKMSQLEELIIPDSFNYEKIISLSNEARQKFIKIKPRTLGQASRISGVNPSDVQILMVYMGR